MSNKFAHLVVYSYNLTEYFYSTPRLTLKRAWRPSATPNWNVLNGGQGSFSREPRRPSTTSRPPNFNTWSKNSSDLRKLVKYLFWLIHLCLGLFIYEFICACCDFKTNPNQSKMLTFCDSKIFCFAF